MLVITANAIDKDVGIYYYMHTNTVTLDPHIHDGFHEIMLVLRGSLTHESEDFRARMSVGEMAFLPSDSTHTISNPTDDLLMLNLCIMLSTFEQAVSYLRIAQSPNRVVCTKVERQVVDYLLWNHARLTETMQSPERTTIIRNTFSLLLPYCCDMTSRPDWFEALLIQMQKQENFQAGVKRMQELAFCSPAHLCRTCKSRLGITPTQYVDRIRIQHARNLLRHAGYRIHDICAECGYNNIGYFYRRFVQETGMPPVQYQKEHYLEIKPLI